MRWPSNTAATSDILQELWKQRWQCVLNGRFLSRAARKYGVSLRGNRALCAAKWCCSFRELSVWRFDLFSEEKPALFAPVPPLLCVPDLAFQQIQPGLNTITVWGLCCYTRSVAHISWASVFRSFSVVEVSLRLSVFIQPRQRAPPSHPEIQKEMTIQLEKAEDGSRSPFRSGETWHDKRLRGKHCIVVTFTSASGIFQPQSFLPPPSTWIIFLWQSVQMYRRLAHPPLKLHCFSPAWALDSKSLEAQVSSYRMA